ncbi:MAG: hypothetical protein JNL84_14320 [Candidatus Accumulibacter sp.]|nr:hypothetical protein [Accumulibacter sp.]
MSRPILKLPNKPATARAAGDVATFRKPLRQGLKTAQRTIVRGETAKKTGEQRPEQRSMPPKAGKTYTAASSRSPAPVAMVTDEIERPALANVERQRPAIAERRQRVVSDRRPAGVVDRLALSATSGEQETVATDPAPVAAGRATNRQSARPGERVYPPRGIARSTGVRASPPKPRAATVDLPPEPAKPMPSPGGASPRSGVPPQEGIVEPARGPARELPRLAKRVCELTGCSRREADEWLENGWIRVDGAVVDRLGARVSPKARVEIAEVAKRHTAAGVTVIFHHPGPVATAVAALAASNHWGEDPPGRRLPASLLSRLSPVARLSVDECGMQVFTEQGSVARRLTDARIESEFHVRIDRTPATEELERLRYGLNIDGVRLKHAQVSLSSDLLLRMVLRESRAGQIAEMCRQLGLQALQIKRVRIGSVALGRLPVGQWRLLRPDERF